MKTRIALACLLLLFSVTAVAAKPTKKLTNTQTGDTVRVEKQEEIQERKEERQLLLDKKRTEIQERIQERKATRSARLQEQNRIKVQTYFGKINTRFDAAITRLETLIDRIEARLAIYQEEDPNLNLTYIQTQLDDAKALLTQTSADIDAAAANIQTVLESDEPQAAFATIKTTVSDAKANLVEVHSILVHVIGDIKGLRIGNTTPVNVDTNTATDEANPV